MGHTPPLGIGEKVRFLPLFYPIFSTLRHFFIRPCEKFFTSRRKEDARDGGKIPAHWAADKKKQAEKPMKDGHFAV